MMKHQLSPCMGIIFSGTPSSGRISGALRPGST
jgi:hypothetical protein